jgi:hypothetical protein
MREMITSNIIKKSLLDEVSITKKNNNNHSEKWCKGEKELEIRSLMIRCLLSLWLFTFVINLSRFTIF